MSFEVDPDALRAHARSIGALRESLASSRRASDLSGDAFGILCQFLTPKANCAQRKALDTIDAMTELAAPLEGSVQGAALDYELADLVFSSHLDRLGTDVDG